MSSASSSLIKQSKKTSLSDYPNVTDYDSDLDAGLWVLWVYQEKLEYDTYLKANEIAEILTTLGVSTKEIEITNAFKRAKKKIDRQDIGGKKAYKIMHEGIEYLKGLKGDKNIEGNKPRTDRTMLNEVVSKAKGEIKIVDKFYSRENLTLLGTFAEKSKIKWLTSALSRGEDENRFETDLSLFRL